VRYDILIGCVRASAFSALGSVGVETACGVTGVLKPDFMDDAELPGALGALATEMRGAGLSTSQLHYQVISADVAICCYPSYPEKFPQSRVIGLARLALNILQILGVPEPQDLQHPTELIVRVPNCNESVRLIEIVPVLEVGRGFQELRREREAYSSDVCNPNEPVRINER
jgi:hypothetical protein